MGRAMKQKSRRMSRGGRIEGNAGPDMPLRATKYSWQRKSVEKLDMSGQGGVRRLQFEGREIEVSAAVDGD